MRPRGSCMATPFLSYRWCTPHLRPRLCFRRPPTQLLQKLVGYGPKPIMQGCSDTGNFSHYPLFLFLLHWNNESRDIHGCTAGWTCDRPHDEEPTSIPSYFGITAILVPVTRLTTVDMCMCCGSFHFDHVLATSTLFSYLPPPLQPRFHRSG